MLKKEHYKTHLPAELYSQIEEICDNFKEIHREADGIVQHGKMPDNTAQLTNVLQSTEEATNTILDAATLINEIAGSMIGPDENKQQIGEHINRIYEACTFQDITGQRIMKVLKNLSLIEEKLSHLSQIARNYSGTPEAPAGAATPSLLDGPALEAPNQADIDKLFSS